jgi:hypothetical protein
MVKEVMRRTASDNPYLHKDFHGALSTGIDYLHRHYGPEAVREYLHQFAADFYAPLTGALKQRGLIVLKEHFEKIYQLEGGQIEIQFSDDEMTLTVKACPAVEHLRKEGYPVAELFYETTRTVNETICEGTDFTAELVEYDSRTGRSLQRFSRKKESKK